MTQQIIINIIKGLLLKLYFTQIKYTIGNIAPINIDKGILREYKDHTSKNFIPIPLLPDAAKVSVDINASINIIKHHNVTGTKLKTIFVDGKSFSPLF